MRIGHGYDVHRLVEGRDLILGGVKLDFEKGLDGHSDADVLLHAVSDALLGAAGLGDIGLHFPDTDPKYKGADSLKLLEAVGQKIAAAGYRVERACCVDMFPGTANVETVCLLSNRKADSHIKLSLDMDEYYDIIEKEQAEKK